MKWKRSWCFWPCVDSTCELFVFCFWAEPVLKASYFGYFLAYRSLLEARVWSGFIWRLVAYLLTSTHLLLLLL